MRKKSIITKDMQITFNDYCMREMKLDITDDGKLYDIESMSILMYGDKYIKYVEDEYTQIKPDEIEMDLLRNPRLMETIATLYINKFATNKGITISSFYQSALKGTLGFSAVSYESNKTNETFKSDSFINESVRTFNLICKLNRTSRMYHNIKEFDIVEVK